MKLLMTVNEVAEATSFSRAHIYRLLASGELASVTIGRARRVRVRDLEEFIERQAQRP